MALMVDNNLEDLKIIDMFTRTWLIISNVILTIELDHVI